jgi:hypothetical protein
MHFFVINRQWSPISPEDRSYGLSSDLRWRDRAQFDLHGSTAGGEYVGLQWQRGGRGENENRTLSFKNCTATYDASTGLSSHHVMKGFVMIEGLRCNTGQFVKMMAYLSWDSEAFRQGHV